MNKSKRNKLTRMIGVCGIALGTLAGSGTVASVIQLGNAKAPVAVVRADTVADKSTARTLNIHKFQAKDNTMPVSDETGTNKATGTTADADKIAGADLTPMAGIQFKVYKLTADEVKAFKESTDQAKYVPSTAAVADLTTDAKGDASFTTNGPDDDGYYLVVEQDNSVVKTKATPFVVHLPLTTKGEDGSRTIQYSVDVYPKNEIATDVLTTNPEKKLLVKDTENEGQLKEAQSTSVKAGSSVTWELTADRPVDAKVTDKDGNAKYATQFVFSDPIDTKSLELDMDSITMSIQTPATETAEAVETTLEKDTDYTIDYTATKETQSSYKVLVLTLTPEGLTKLGEAAAGSKVKATISTKVLTGKTDAQIMNTFDTYYTGTTNVPVHDTTIPNDPTDPKDDPKDPGDPKDPTDPGTPNDPNGNDPTNPTVYMGNVDVLKTDVSEQPLANATFKLADSEENAKNGVFVTDADGNELSVVTDANGKAEFTGLLVDPEKKTQLYYLVETDAPVGYDVDGEIHEVTAKQDTEIDATVVDPDNALPNLPLTGAQGRILILAIASVTLLGSGSYMILRKRREAND